MANNDLTCNGEGCRFKMICDRYTKWMVSDDDEEEPGLIPAYSNGNCPNLIRNGFYGG